MLRIGPTPLISIITNYYITCYFSNKAYFPWYISIYILPSRNDRRGIWKILSLPVSASREDDQLSADNILWISPQKNILCARWRCNSLHIDWVASSLFLSLAYWASQLGITTIWLYWILLSAILCQLPRFRGYMLSFHARVWYLWDDGYCAFPY